MSQVVGSRRNPGANGAGNTPRILVVDDEPYMCDVCSRTLQRGGYAVVATSDPQAAARMLRGDERFDLLLTDIKMPAMSGLELAYIAREQDPTIAIIIMTGFATMENLQQSVQRGIADFLSKPFELEHLRLAVDQALHKRSILQDNVRLAAVERLLDSSQALSATLELAEVADTLLRVSLEQTNFRAGFVVLMAEPQAPLTIVPSLAGGTLFPAGHALIERAFREQQPQLADGEQICQVDGAALGQALALPLRAQGKINGVLLLCDDHASMLRPGVLESVSLLANHAGAALRNASLYGELDKAYQRAQELDRLKSEFISIASHELRTPLSIVLGYTMMVRDQSENEKRLYLERVMDSAQRIKDIVDDMVSLRHLDTGETELAPDQVVIQELIRNAIERVRPGADERRQTITLDMPDQPLLFVCDHEKVLLILGHLLTNAVRFTPPKGAIEIRARLRPSGPIDSGGSRIIPASQPTSALPWVVVEVQDTGIGIPESELPRIFDRFYQVADSLTRDHGGIGLGLALVRELVSALGGAVWVASQAGQGSTFAVALPYRQPVAGTPQQ
ncbi:MAG TPA: response regulator [Kouleothrix sp.]|uniref:hybrid sensor histidine kinase/response regulator n=1 Tax=Kouleothrix sp. TaxID=2779161 RepID=UPI002BA69F34|nr:response regulator [Kouleothrix sp.]HRC76897.1 response regulator [Kouleothrix sp.]